MSIGISVATYPRSYRQFQGSLTPQTWLGCRAENDEMLLPSRELGEGFALFFFVFFYCLNWRDASIWWWKEELLLRTPHTAARRRA